MSRLIIGLFLPLLILLGVVPAAEAAQPPTADRGGDWAYVDSMIEKSLDADEIPGATVVVVDDGKVVLERGYGAADAFGEYPMRTETVFRTASQAKLFVTAAVLQLEAEGKLDLHADVNRYLRGTSIENTFPGRPVTLHHVLTHTGGFDQNLTGVATTDPDRAETLAEYVHDHQPRRKAPPGTVMAYENYGFDVAALIVQQVSGQPYEQYLKENLFEPLGMRSSTANPGIPTESVRTPTRGFLANGKPVSLAFSGALGSGAGPQSNTKDMARFLTAVLQEDPRLGEGVAAAMRKQRYAQSKRVPGMAYGFQHKTWQGVDVLYKGGDLPGQHNAMLLVPSRDLGVFVMFHGDGSQGGGAWYPQAVARRVLERAVASDAGTDTDRGTDRGAGAGDAPAAEANGIGGDVSEYAGSYRRSYTSEDSVLAISGLISGVTVEAAAPGELVTTGLGDDPEATERRWIQDSPGHFVSADGYDQIAFSDGVMASTTAEAETLERVAWWESSQAGMVLLGFGAVALVVAWFVFGALAVRRMFGRPGNPPGAKIAAILGWLTSGVAIGFLSTFLPVAMGVELEQMVMLGSGVFLASQIQNTVLLWCVAVCLPFAVLAWARGWWGVLGRVGYSVFVLGGLAFLAFAFDYNLILFPYW